MGLPISTAIFWWGHDEFGAEAKCGAHCPANTLAPLLVLSLLPPLRSAGAECGATCGGPLTADRESDGYSGSCWENDLIMAIPLLQCARLAMPYRAPRHSEGSWPTPALTSGVVLRPLCSRVCVCRSWLAAPFVLTFVLGRRQGCRGGGGGGGERGGARGRCGPRRLRWALGWLPVQEAL